MKCVHEFTGGKGCTFKTKEYYGMENIVRSLIQGDVEQLYYEVQNFTKSWFLWNTQTNVGQFLKQSSKSVVVCTPLVKTKTAEKKQRRFLA